MDLMSGHKNRVQGAVGLVFGNENSASSKDSYVERLLDRISNAVLAEDRRTVIAELQFIVAESRFPVLLSVLKEERDDVEMVRGALETLVSALTLIDQPKALKNEVQPTLMNTDLLSREAESISLLLSLLWEEDFYIRYYTQQLLTVLLTNSRNRLQEAILTIPRGITRLMDMLMDREALLLLTYLTHEAEEIQKILVFEGAFEKIFSIIKEEGCSESGVVVQDCLELLNNLIRNNASNKVLLRETMGVDPLISIVKLRGSSYMGLRIIYLFILTRKCYFLLITKWLILRRISLAITNKVINIMLKLLHEIKRMIINNHLLIYQQKETSWCALRCIGDLIASHTKNLDPQVEHALNSILRIILRTSNIQEFVAADCKNPDGQAMLASTLIPQPQTTTLALPEEDVNMSFGSLRSCCMSQTFSKVASVLSHVLKYNMQCKERVLQIELEESTPSLGAPEPLLHRVVKYLALASCMKSKEEKPNASGNAYVQAIILKLLVIWHSDCPSVVQCFLDSSPHLTYLLELVSNSTVCIRGLAVVILGECVIYNKSSDSGKDAFTIVDAISREVGLTSYFLKFEEMQKSIIFSSAKPAEPRKPLTRSTAASMDEIDDVEENEASDLKNEDHPMLASMFDAQFVDFIRNSEANIRESIIDVYSHPKSKVAVVSTELQQKGWESDGDYVKRVKSFVEKQCSEITPEHRSSGGSKSVQLETLHRDLQEASQRLDTLKIEKTKIESEASMYCNLAGKMEFDLKSLSDAYNSLEQANFHLEKEIKALKTGGATPIPDVEAVKAKAREEAQKESEAELNDLLVCLGQEQSKVEKLSVRLLELGEDVDKLLEGIGDDIGLLEDAEVEED
ncbi:Golgin candidate 6 [Camellia lanceoleosa]|uniref:Golgin candidate 6 n=1 Tax=Camellia lanceoleosa TaxID=1840588 RepID=A0ACC0G0H2_9ERIC|nr:Golgin candidate 6 [Camellia lanceoleosa]